MNTKEKAAWLADLYQHVADGGELEEQLPKKWLVSDFQYSSPCLSSSTTQWRKKPMAQAVDLTCLIDGIDCEFSYPMPEEIFYGRLSSIAKKSGHPYKLNNQRYFNRCRPRMDYIHAWRGGKCPLPEGVRVRVWLRDDTSRENAAVRLCWAHQQYNSDIINFEVIGLADGYVWPWQEVES